jgi:DNA-binding NarL/FixJ family response regulator
VLIADDHAILRRGLKEILERDLDDVVASEAASADQVLEQIAARTWDLVILDITMPGRSGLEVLTALRQRRPHPPVLVLSMHPEDQYGKRVLRAGAAGYMTKESAPAELIQAVRRILAGGRYVSPALAETLADDLAQADRSASDRLSDREFDVLCKVAQGRSVSQIAEECHLSQNTVATYRARVLEKLGLSTTADLVRYALVNRLVQ